VGDDQSGRGRATEDPGNLDGEPVMQLAVEAGERLVEQQRTGRGRQRAGEGDALGLAAAEVGDVAATEAGEPDEVEHLLDAPVALGCRQTLHLQPEPDVRRHRAVGEQLLVLEHHPDPAAVGGNGGEVPAVEAHGTRLGSDETGDHAQQGALATARRPEQGDDLAVADGERDAIEDHRAGERDGDVTNVEHGRRLA
jgi:hypothetical protein